MKKTIFDKTLDRQSELINYLNQREDSEAQRIKRYIQMKDLSLDKESPLYEVIERVKKVNTLKDFDEIRVPEIVSVQNTFDLFNFPKDHPARSKSDTYYVDENNILRTHTTIMWYYYFNLSEVLEKLENDGEVGAISYGKVYRKDEIDRRHMNIFHQVDGLYVCKKEKHIINQDDLKNVLREVAVGTFGKEIRYRFNPDTFPYTFDSLEMEIDKGSLTPDNKEEWVEVLGAGIVEPKVLEKLGIDSSVYNGWAFGFGLERLAIISMELPDIRLFWSEDPRVIKQLKLGQKFIEVSKYPQVTRDISFIVDNSFVPNDYFDLVRDILPDIVEEVLLLDKYENEEKFGKNKVSYAYRITYRSLNRTLTDLEVNNLHKKIENATVSNYNAKIR
jgi:phenylalanyl-tRNA synthetase alpha chain